MSNDLKDRTKRYALDILRSCSALPNQPEFRCNGNQLMCAGTSVGADYRSDCLSKSKADFISKLSIVEEEADESEYWLELVENRSPANRVGLSRLKSDASQLVAIMVQSKKTARIPVRNSKFAI